MKKCIAIFGLLIIGITPTLAQDRFSMIRVSSVGPSPTWKQILLGGGGYVTGISIANDGTDAMFVRTDTNGAYVWNPNAPSPKRNAMHAGAWMELVTTQTMPSSAWLNNLGSGTWEIVPAPKNSQILYMVYGDGHTYVSTNQGATWIKQSVPQDTNAPWNSGTTERTVLSVKGWGQKMAVSPSNSSLAYIGYPSIGMYVTTNEGSGWNAVSGMPMATSDGSGNYPGYSCMEFNRANPNDLYAYSYGNGIYETTNAGSGSSSSWSKINNGSGPSTCIYSAISASGVYYVVDGRGDLWSYNGSWTEQISDGKSIAVATDPNNSSHVIALAGGFGGSSGGQLNENTGTGWSGWSQVAYSEKDAPWLSGLNPYALANVSVIFDRSVPDKLIATSTAAIATTTLSSAISSSTTVTWDSQIAGVEQLVVNQFLSTSAGLLIDVWDHGTFLGNTSSYPTTFAPLATSVCAAWSMDSPAGNTSFVVAVIDGYYAGSCEKSGYSNNGGASWTSFAHLPSGIGSAIIEGDIAATSMTNFMWGPFTEGSCGAPAPYYTADGGNTWSQVILPGNPSNAVCNPNQRWIAADRVLPNTFYVYTYTGRTNGQLFTCTNGGATCSNTYTFNGLSGSGPNGLSSNGKLIAVPGRSGNLLLNDGNKLWKSTNGGASWTAIGHWYSGTLGIVGPGVGAPLSGGDYPAIYVLAAPTGSLRAYGVWQSSDGGSTWVNLGIPLDNVATQNTVYGDPNTYGRVYVGGGTGAMQYNFLLKRDLAPPSNDNTPIGLHQVG